MIFATKSQQNFQTNKKITKDNPYWNKARFYRQYNWIKKAAKNVVNAIKPHIKTGSLNDRRLINFLFIALRICYAHNKIEISRKNIAEKLGCDVTTAGDIIDKLYEMGLLHKITQSYKNGKPTTNKYILTDVAFESEFIEFIFWLAKAFNKLDYFMLLGIRKVISRANTSLLSSSHIYESLSTNVSLHYGGGFYIKKPLREELTKHGPPKLTKYYEDLAAKPKNIPTKGKTMVVNNQNVCATNRETNGFKNITELIAEWRTAVESNKNKAAATSPFISNGIL